VTIPSPFRLFPGLSFLDHCLSGVPSVVSNVLGDTAGKESFAWGMPSAGIAPVAKQEHAVTLHVVVSIVDRVPGTA
jgi:hypothetical protein